MSDNPVIITQPAVVVVPTNAGALTQGPPGPPGSGSTIGVKDEGTLVSSTVQRLNFVGANVAVSGSGADVDIDVTGGGGGAGGFATRTALAASVTPQLHDMALLGEAGREGVFVCDAAASWTTLIAADTAKAVFVQSTADAGKVWRRIGWSELNPAWFGAVLDWNEATASGTNDSAAMLAAVALSKAMAGNDRAGFYRGGPSIRIPAGKTLYMAAVPIDVTHVWELLGFGSGYVNAAPAGAIRWANGTSGIRIQNVLTSGDSTVDGAAHLGAGVFKIRGLKLVGGYAGVEGNSHCIDPKAPFDIDDVWIDNWSGEGINGLGNIVSNQRNVSLSSLRHFRISGCRIGFYPRGPDANIISVGPGWFNENRRAGYVDESTIGSNNLNGVQFAANGGNNGGIPNQTSLSGNRYALKWGGNSSNSPSGTTADTADWLYIEAGGPVSGIPTWTSATVFRAGGDCITVDQPIVTLNGCYFEEGGFQQFGGNTMTINGALSDRYFRGGARIRAGLNELDVLGGLRVSGGLTSLGMTTILGNTTGTAADNNIYLDCTNLFNNVLFRAGGVVKGLLQVGNGSSWFDVPTGHYVVVNGTVIQITDSTGINLQSGKVLKIGGTTVLNGQMTHTADLAAAPTAADFNALLAKLQAVHLMA